MIVECPRCNARYRVDEEVVADEPTFKCSRCDHLFSHEAGAADLVTEPEPSDPEPVTPAPAAVDVEGGDEEEPAEAPDGASPRGRRLGARRPTRADSSSLSLPFATSQSEPGGPSTIDDDEVDLPPRRGPSTSGRERHFDFDHDEEHAIDDDGDDDAAASDRSIGEPRFVRSFAASQAPVSSVDRLRRPVLIFLAVLLLFYGNLALYFRNHAAKAERSFASVPLFGRLLVENRLLQSRVYLRDLEGVFQRIKDGRTVFIVSGRAVNTAEAPVRGVEVESALYDAAGTSLLAKSIFCGNAMSLKIVKDLSSKEISILQKLQPPQRFEIAPGDAAGFSVVFLDPPAEFVEFSARVASAQPSIS